MECPDYEPLILDWLDGELAMPDRQRVAAHVAECPACQELANTLKGLDTALSRAIRPISLPSDFTGRVLKRVESEGGPGRSAGDVANRRQQLEAEFRDGSNRLRRRMVDVGGWLDGLGFGVLGFILVYVGYHYGVQWIGASPWASSLAGHETLLRSCLGSTVLLAVGTVGAFSRQLGRWVSALG